MLISIKNTNEIVDVLRISSNPSTWYCVLKSDKPDSPNLPSACPYSYFDEASKLLIKQRTYAKIKPHLCLKAFIK